MYLKGWDAVRYAERTGVQLEKYADEVDGARMVTVDEAYEIALEDPSLIFIMNINRK